MHSPAFSIRFRYVFALLVSAFLTGAGQTPAFAGESHLFDIAENEASIAVRDFARQAGVEILASGELLKGKVLRPVTGEYSTETALTLLLAQSGLTHRYVGERGVVLVAIGNEDAGIRQEGKPTANARHSELLRLVQSEKPLGAGASDPQEHEQASAAAGSENRNSRVDISEIVVTAQKRTERLQDVPIPVTSLDAQMLVNQNQLRLQDYYTRVPGLNMVLNDYGTPQLVIRGITTGGYINPTVGIVVDDVPFGSSSGLALGEFAPDFDPSDLQRIEVLRGPQGTLYGASSIGGLIKFMTVDPSTKKLSGRVQAGLNGVRNSGDLGYAVRGSLNLPLGDTFAVRASGHTRREAGYIDDPGLNIEGVNEVRIEGAHVSALWQPLESLSLKLSAIYQRSQADGLPNEDVEPGLSDFEQSMVRGSGVSDRVNRAYSATLTAKLGRAELTSVTGFNVTRSIAWLDYSNVIGGLTEILHGTRGTPVSLTNETEKFSQEIRLSIPVGERIEWLLGAFYTDEDSSLVEYIFAADPPTGNVVGLPFFFTAPSTFRESAGFANLTFNITDRFDVQIGGRESSSKQYYKATSTGGFVPIIFLQEEPYVQGPTRSKESSFTYLLTPRFKISSDFMLYARLASGYQPGGPNINTAGISVPPAFKAATTQNYEVGVKGTVMNRRISFDASLYHIDWNDIQLYLIDPVTGAAYYTNGGGARSRGIELSMESRVLPSLTIAAAMTWNDADLTEPFPATATAYGLAGDRLPYGSRLSGNISIESEFPLTSRIRGFAGAALSYVGDRVGQFTAVPQRQKLGAYARTDVHVGLTHDSWTYNLFLNNVFDRRGLLDGGLGTFDPLAFHYIQPRTVGLSLAKHF